jgi:hypothetical protein
MICSSRSRDKFVKEGLSGSAAKYKATYLYVYLADKIKLAQANVRRDPGNELHQYYLNNLKRNKAILLKEKNEDKVNYILDKLYSDLNYEFDLGGK